MTLKPDVVRSLPQIADRIASEVCKCVCELPDRTSPDDWPEACLVTPEELRLIVTREIEEALESRTLPLDGDVVERVRDSLGKTEAALDNGLTPHELDELTTAAITATRSGDGELRWQPIETIPQNGTVLICGRWDEGHEYDGQPWWNFASCTDTGFYGDWHDEAIPTHWMHPPAAPDAIAIETRSAETTKIGSARQGESAAIAHNSSSSIRDR